MAGEMNLRDPWLVAVWPGMGHVAVSAGYYLMAKLGMHEMMDQKLTEILAKMEGAFEASESSDEELYGVPSATEDQLSAEDEQHIDDLFGQAEVDRSKAYELKRELDRLEVFDRYEDRFLDLFKKKPE